MARLPHPIADVGAVKGLSRAELSQRRDTEAALMGAADALEPPVSWSAARKAAYASVVEAFPPGSLCNLDAFILQELAISIERKQAIDRKLDKPDKDTDRAALIRERKHYLDSMSRCMKDLGMSRVARAQIADRAAAAAKKKATVFTTLGDGE